MKVSSAVMVVLLVVCVASTVSAARRSRKNRSCRYDKGTWSECDTDTNTRTLTKNLIGNTEGCDATKTKTKRCPTKCKYVKSGTWSDCDSSNQRHMTQTLNRAKSAADCPETKVKTKNCRVNQRPAKGCVYDTSQWSDCDQRTNTRTRTQTLTAGDPTVCESEKVITKKCVNNMRKKNKRKQKGGKCKYSGAWGPCNPRSNTMQRTLTLVTGPASCVASKVMSRKCKKVCRFKKGEWTECDPYTHLKSRVDTLAQGEPQNCDATRTLTRKCKKIKCTYTAGDWGECSPDTQERTRVLTLTGGDRDKCQPQKTVTRSCLRPNGKERCFFGAWGEFGSCMNGVATKYRRVLQGGTDCERKAVKTKAC